MFTVKPFSKVRRGLLAAAMTVTAVAAMPMSAAQAADPIKVAAIYTVPVEQQWVSRIDKALKAAEERGDITYTFSENVANTDYERVMREYAEQGWTWSLGKRSLWSGPHARSPQSIRTLRS
jgi:basic membrane protein A